jgi:hypothetical protein
MFVCVWNGQQALTQKRCGPFRAGRVFQPQNSKLDHARSPESDRYPLPLLKCTCLRPHISSAPACSHACHHHAGRHTLASHICVDKTPGTGLALQFFGKTQRFEMLLFDTYEL